MLPEQRKQAMRQRLLAAANAPDRFDGTRWLAPTLVAAAVLAIVGGGALLFGHDRGGSHGSQGFQPGAGSAGPTTGTFPSDGRTTTTGLVTTGPATTGPITKTSPPPQGRHHGSTTHSQDTGSGDDLASCQQEIADMGDASLEGAVVTAQRDYGAGTSFLFESSKAWVVCDTWAGLDGGAPTLLPIHAESAPYEPGVATLSLSENLQMGNPMPSEFVAGGRGFDGVRAIAYTFPDGHTEDAVTVDGLWSMTYLPTSGVLTDPDVDETTLGPITVSVHLTNGDTTTYTLQWGVDTCAQINHGC